MICDFFRINLLIIASILFGPFLAVYLSFYNDVYTLSKEYVSINLLLETLIKFELKIKNKKIEDIGISNR